MNFATFDLVEWQHAYEHCTQISLADSGSRAIELSELVSGDELRDLLAIRQSYPAVTGTAGLRALIADRHGAEPDNVLVTVGGTEANAVALEAIVRPGDGVVVVTPGYGQIPGYAANLGATVTQARLDPDDGWSLDVDGLGRAVTRATVLIAVTNPNNPTGMVLSDAEIDAVIGAAERVGAWLLVDEVHRGTELHTDEETRSLWGRYDRLVCVGSLSKAFGLPGLRVGWLIGPPELIDLARQHHEYVAVSNGQIAMRLAELALRPATAQRLIDGNRARIRRGAGILAGWIAGQAGLVSMTAADATSLGFVRYHFELPSIELAQAIRQQANVLVVPAAHFGVEGHFRLTHGLEPELIETALHRIGLVLEKECHG